MKTQCTPGQGFGGNDVATYKAGGLLGHTAIDNQCGYGTPINSYWDKEYVYKVLTKENPANDGSGFTGIFTIVEQDGVVFEFLYGHCDPNPGLLGTTLTKNQFIGREGNNGEVYSGVDGNLRITLEMQKSGDTRGAHRHDQARMLRKDTSIQPNTRYLTTLGGGYLYLNGYFYAIPNYDNGYNGCFDWTKLGEDTPFTRLQKALYDFQVSEGIKPYQLVGPQTKKALNKYLVGDKYKV
jgi:hypothetical protein